MHQQLDVKVFPLKTFENYNYFIESVKKEKPDTIKGEFIKGIYLTTTMGVSYKIGAK